MFRAILIWAILAGTNTVTAQQNAIPAKAQTVLDSLNTLASRQWFTDSLSITSWGDSLRNDVTSQTTTKVNQLNQKIDSLNQLQLPTGKYTHKLDSIQQKSNRLLVEVNQKQQQLLGKTKVNLGEWQNKLKLNVDQDLNLPTTDLKIPELSALDFQGLELSTELSALNEKLPFGEIGGLTEWKSKLPDMGINMPAIKDFKANPDKLIETAATNIDGVQELKDKLNVPGIEQTEFGKLAKDMQNPEAMKEVAVEKVKQEAINHFAGKEQALQSAMEQISKLKMKYPSVNSLSEIPKKGSNAMKGKPFVERFIPGFGMQIHSKGYLNFDLNPFAAYRITGKLTGGFGWNQRLAMDWSTKKIVPEGRVYGPRGFVEYKLPKGFAARVEGEWMNSFVPPFYLSGGDGKRQWVFSSMTGLKKDFRFIKGVRGFTVIQFDLVRLIKPNGNSPYSDVVNTRFGFEFPMKKKVKQKTKEAR
jgi:hypothetical protein